MKSTSARSGSSSTNIVHRGEVGVGPFMLTLCRLVEPVSIRPPQSPHLRPFTFFTSRECRRDGSEELYLHMGFFETLAYAERWVRAVRGRHPDALATIVPPALWQLDSDSPPAQHFAPVDNDSLTDSQVLNILEMRRPAPAQSDDDERSSEQIEILRPEDTGTRLALKEAVVQGAPISFAVQLQWSVRPIDPTHVPPALTTLQACTLYAVESRRASRSCFFLRLGFFGDPVSAKQVAARLRSSFPSAAVVPVLDEEIMRAREACMDTSLVPCIVQQRHDQTFAFGSPSSTAAKPEVRRRRDKAEGAETLEQTLAQLAERELWNDPDVLSDTGVRHLKVEVQGRSSGRH